MIKYLKNTKETKKITIAILGVALEVSAEKEVILRFNTESGEFSRLTTYQVYSDGTLIAYRIYEWNEYSEEKLMSSFGSHEIMIDVLKVL